MALNDDKKKLQDPAYAAGASVRRALSGGTSWDSMGQGYMARGQAAAQVAAPVRGFTKGLLGATPDAPVAPAVAKPSFADVRGGIRTSSGSPSQRMTDSQANAAEVNARTATQPASPPTGMGVPAGAGGAAPIRPGDPNTFTGTNGITRRVPMPGTMDAATNQSGSVQSQNFGNPVVPQAQASIAQPRVASTFGLGVNDPRINDQAPAIASPNAAARGFGLASADSISRYNANKEDREATKKLLGDIDTQMFMARGKNTPSARRLMAELAGAQAQAIGNMAGNTNAQISDNTRGQFTLANTGMEQSGQTQRQQMAGDVASQGQFLDYDAKNRATDASLIERPTMKQAADGSLYSVTGTRAAAVTGPDGQQLRAAVEAPQQQRDYQAEAFNSLVSDLLDGQRDMAGALPPNALENAIAQAQKVQAARQPQGGQAKVAPTLDAYVKAARAAGFNQSDAELAAAFKKKYPQAQ